MDEKTRSAFRQVTPRLVQSYVILPIGCVTVLLVCCGVDRIIRAAGLKFPASVTLMMLLFSCLVVSAATIGERRTGKVVKIVDVPLGFALRWINIFFTPSFVMLPLSAKMSGTEAGVIIAVFLIGYVIVFAATALSVKGIQALLGTEKARAQERRREDSPTGSPDDLELEYIPQTTPTSSTTPLLAPAPAAEPARIRGAGPVCTSLSNIRQIESPIRQYPTSISSLSPSTFHRILAHLLLHLDTTIYALIFLLIGLPTYYAIGYTMPLHLSLTILAYRLSTKLPSSILRFLHPVLGCSALTLLGILILSHSLSRTESLTSALQSYSTGTRYLTLFTTTTPSSLPLPGAGDIFASLLDISIISLSMPMYTHRRALRLNILSILPPCLILSIASLTLYPLVCNLLSISPTRSKTFAARSLTLALATPAVANLGGDTQFIALLSIVSGIVGALVAERGFRLLRVKEEDFVTRGVVIGANSAAIGTAWLVGRGDVRAAAVSSVSMVLLGTVVVVLTSLPALRGVVEGLVGEA